MFELLLYNRMTGMIDSLCVQLLWIRRLQIRYPVNLPQLLITFDPSRVSLLLL